MDLITVTLFLYQFNSILKVTFAILLIGATEWTSSSSSSSSWNKSMARDQLLRELQVKIRGYVHSRSKVGRSRALQVSAICREIDCINWKFMWDVTDCMLWALMKGWHPKSQLTSSSPCLNTCYKRQLTRSRCHSFVNQQRTRQVLLKWVAVN